LARGSVAANVWPNLRVSVGSTVLGNITVNTTSYAAYNFSFTASSGTAEVRVQFTNDLNQNGQDRNLYVDRIDIGCGTAPVPSCTDGIKNGSETAVDCGGSCSADCANGQACSVNADCVSASCVNAVCKAPTAKVTASLSMQSTWSGGYCANLKVTNSSTAAISSWSVNLNTNQSTIYNSWSATFSGTGSLRSVTPQSHNAALGAGASTVVGFCANTTGSNWQPTIVSAN